MFNISGFNPKCNKVCNNPYIWIMTINFQNILNQISWKCQIQAVRFVVVGKYISNKQCKMYCL